MLVGWSKKIITPDVRDVPMMGYGYEKNIVKGKATELYCRCVWMQANGFDYIYLYLDINYITSNIHSALASKIKERFGIDQEQIQICASHTHSAPGGYGDKLYYEIPTPGFKENIFNTYVENSFKAVVDAHQKISPAKITFGVGEFSEKDGVAINRSMTSYFKNPEAKGDETRENALNLNMEQIHFEKESGRAVINWFGCHTTSIPNFMTKIHYDNKGYACHFMEEYLGPNSLAVFAQALSGDISPNFCWDTKTKQMRGPFKNYDKNAQFNGDLQFLKAKEIFEGDRVELKPSMKSYKKVVCFKNLASKDKSLQLGPASFGTAFMTGTLEGPGAPKIVSILVSILLNILLSFKMIISKLFSPETYKYQKFIAKAHGEKNIFINVSDKEFGGFNIKKGIPLVHFIDIQVKKMNNLLSREMYQKAHSWYEENLTLQLTQLDNILIVALPFELTTMSGRRVIARLKDLGGYSKVIINAYSNSYAGYITTPEEYSNQDYEGGHTVFGKASLPILIEQLELMCQKLKTR